MSRGALIFKEKHFGPLTPLNLEVNMQSTPYKKPVEISSPKYVQVGARLHHFNRKFYKKIKGGMPPDPSTFRGFSIFLTGTPDHCGCIAVFIPLLVALPQSVAVFTIVGIELSLPLLVAFTTVTSRVYHCGCIAVFTIVSSFTTVSSRVYRCGYRAVVAVASNIYHSD